MVNGFCTAYEFWYRNNGNIAISFTWWGRLNDFRLQYHKRIEKTQSELHRRGHSITRCASQMISIPTEDVVEGVVREDVGEDVEGGEENRLSNVFLLYGHQNQWTKMFLRLGTHDLGVWRLIVIWNQNIRFASKRILPISIGTMSGYPDGADGEVCKQAISTKWCTVNHLRITIM